MMMSKSFRMTSPMCIITTAIAILALVSVTLGTSAQSDIALHAPQKRNLGRMCLMMWYYTDRFCLDYNDYGCYCGLGGSGNPVDAVDACCQEHDRCYDSVVCGWNNIWPKQAVLYSYDCSSGKCVCTDSPQDSCEYNTCQCDVKFAECIGRSSFNERYKGYDKSKC